jgi:hypothetical protein
LFAPLVELSRVHLPEGSATFEVIYSVAESRRSCPCVEMTFGVVDPFFANGDSARHQMGVLHGVAAVPLPWS